MKLFFLAIAIVAPGARAALITTPTAATVTLVQKQARAAGSIRSGTNQVFHTLADQTKALSSVVWANEYGLTPQQVLAALGADQCDAHEKFVGLASLLNGIVPGTIPAEPKAVTESGTGSACLATVAQ